MFLACIKGRESNSFILGLVPVYEVVEEEKVVRKTETKK